MSFVLAASAAVAAGTGIYKIAAGSKQVRQGKELNNSLVTPTYTRPNEVNQALNIAERNYTNGMPGVGLYKNDINTNAAASMAAAQEGAASSGDVLDAATKINNNTNNAYNNLVKSELEYKNKASADYIQQLNTNAQYSDKEFSYNQDQPYQRKAAAASALIGAGNQNIYSGLDDISGTASSAIGAFGTGGTGGKSISGAPNPGTMGKMIFDPATNTWRQAS